MEKEKTGSVAAEFLVLTAITTLIWGIICACKQIWPFGPMVLDIGDMQTQCIPMYTHLWDVLHGQKALLFDWYTGGGNNMSGPVLHFGLVSPFNLFFLFIKRSAVETSMSVYILIKLVAIGMSMRMVLKKWTPGLSAVMRVSFSLLYVFCAFNMQYYYAVMWLDVSFMFPLVMYGYFLLLNEKKRIPYTVFLAVTCMMSFQHTYMLLLMLLLLTGILPLISKEKYGGSLTGLLTATLTAMMLSAWILLPGTLQILGSARLENGIGLIDVFNSVWVFYTAKWMKLLNMGIPLGFFAVYAIRHFKEKTVKFFGFVIVVLCLPICLESTNILWHGGIYEGYTMRFSYMLPFWILIAGAYAYDSRCKQKQDVGNKAAWMTATGMLLVAAMTVWQYVLLKSDGYVCNNISVYKDNVPAVAIILIVAITMLGGWLLLHGRKEVLETCFLVFVILQSLTLAQTSVFTGGDVDSTHVVSWNRVAQQAGEDQSNLLIRTKNLEAGYENVPLIMRKYAATGYLAVDSARKIDEMVNLGYVRAGNRMNGCGGTVFSDALLGMNETITVDDRDINEKLYQYQNAEGGFCFYRNVYSYRAGEGIKIKNPAQHMDFMNMDPLSAQNQVAGEILGREVVDITAEEGNEINLQIDEESILYLYAEHGENARAVKVTEVSTGETKTFLYEDDGMNGIQEMGIWQDADINIQILSEKAVGKIFCGVLDLREFAQNEPSYFEEFSLKTHPCAAEIVLDGAGESDSLFLPISREEDWKCRVNGRNTEVGGTSLFMVIPLQEGRNEVELSFTPRGFTLGVWITLAGILLLVYAGCRRRVEKERKVLNRVFWFADEAVFAAIMVLFYVLPVLFLVKEMIRMVVGR